MVYDPVMNVGKTPQITSDLAINPLNIYDDVTPLCFPILDISGGGITVTGSLVNVINPNFDYNANTAFNGSANATRSFVITFDLGKTLVLRGILLYFQMQGASGTDSTNVVIDISSDGINYITLETVIKGSGTQNFTKTYTDTQLRVLRLTVNIVSGGNTAGFTFNTMQLKMSPVQRFY